MLTLHKDSHLDHGLTQAHLHCILDKFKDRTGFFAETFEMPPGMPSLSCGLYGPLMGDPIIYDREVMYLQRGRRTWPSRLVDWPHRPSRQLTVIAGPHDGHECVLYTAYAGPQAPREPDDPLCSNREESLAFWSEHALATTE